MNYGTFMKAHIAALIASEQSVRLNRFTAELKRKITRNSHELIYFHRADDPYCQLMVQVIPELQKRFDVIIRPKVVERLPANMYPDPERYEAYSIIDTARLARLYGLGFPDAASVPDRLGVGMINRYLASKEEDPNFFSIAEELGEALWQQDVTVIRNHCAVADMVEDRLSDNEQLLSSLGHYASGTIYYGGEFYTGLDRLDHLEMRLNALGVGDGEIHYELTRLWRYGLKQLDRSIAGRGVDFYFSVRSPYSYLGLVQILNFAAETGIHLRLKPVLPMMMRGMLVPPKKSRYIFHDAAREARRENIPFGKVADPLGAATQLAMSIGFKAMEDGLGEAFFKAVMQAVWSEGIDASDLQNIKSILERSDLPLSLIDDRLSTKDWESRAEANLSEMFSVGSWGVPTIRVGTQTMWGQDRLWAIPDALKKAKSKTRFEEIRR